MEKLHANKALEFIIYNDQFDKLYRIYCKYNSEKILSVLEKQDLDINNFRDGILYIISNQKISGKEELKNFDYNEEIAKKAQIDFFMDDVKSKNINKLIIDLIINLGIEDKIIEDDNYFFNIGDFNGNYIEN